MLRLNLTDLSGCNSFAQTLNAIGSSLCLGRLDTQVSLTNLSIPMVPKPGLGEPQCCCTKLPLHTVCYTLLYVRWQRTGDRSSKPFLLTASQELGLVVHVTRASHKEQFKPSEPRNALQRERLDGLERWEGDIRVLGKLAGLHPHQGGKANYHRDGSKWM